MKCPQVLIFLLCMIYSSQSAEVLFLPSPFFTSRSMPMLTLANALAGRGHRIKWIDFGSVKLEFASSIKREFWNLSAASDGNVRADRSRWTVRPSSQEVYYHSTVTESMQLCSNIIMGHKDKLDVLAKRKFDVIVVDDQLNPCGLLVTSLSKAVFVYWSQTLMRPESAWAHQSPFPPSYVPVPGTRLTDEMSFIERTINLFAYLQSLFIHQQIMQPRIDKTFQRSYSSLPKSFDMERNASLNFINTPPIFDFPRPHMPRVVFVGCIQCRVAADLPMELTTFLDKRKFMVISFGAEQASDKIISQLVDAMASRPSIKFVLQFTTPADLPSNVFVSHVPLQDLLGHSDCIGHVSHGGLNSVVESVWHGVPVIGLPDQHLSHDNLLRLSARGAAVLVETKELSLHRLIEAIDVIQHARFKQEMETFQDMLRDVPYTELEHAVFWIEFIDRHHEIPHSRSGADHLNIIQYFLVDVIVFILSFLYLTYQMLRFLLKIGARICSCFKPTMKSKKD